MSSENVRFYDRTKHIPVEEVKSADGKKMIKPTIRHARKLGLLPSVSSICKTLASHQLTDWIARNAIKTAAKLPMQSLAGMLVGDTEEDRLDAYADFVMSKAGEFTAECADTGKLFHAAISKMLDSNLKDMPEEGPMLVACTSIAGRVASMQFQSFTSEAGLGDAELGFAGTPDVFAVQPELTLIADTKTTDLEKFKEPYESWKLQLGGYYKLISKLKGTSADTVWEQWVVDRNTGEFKPITYADADMQQYALAFEHLFAVWCVVNKYNPKDA